MIKKPKKSGYPGVFLSFFVTVFVLFFIMSTFSESGFLVEVSSSHVRTVDEHFQAVTCSHTYGAFPSLPKLYKDVPLVQRRRRCRRALRLSKGTSQGFLVMQCRWSRCLKVATLEIVVPNSRSGAALTSWLKVRTP